MGLGVFVVAADQGIDLRGARIVSVPSCFFSPTLGMKNKNYKIKKKIGNLGTALLFK